LLGTYGLVLAFSSIFCLTSGLCRASFVLCRIFSTVSAAPDRGTRSPHCPTDRCMFYSIPGECFLPLFQGTFPALLLLIFSRRCCSVSESWPSPCRASSCRGATSECPTSGLEKGGTSDRPSFAALLAAQTNAAASAKGTAGWCMPDGLTPGRMLGMQSRGCTLRRRAHPLGLCDVMCMLEKSLISDQRRCAGLLLGPASQVLEGAWPRQHVASKSKPDQSAHNMWLHRPKCA
jgi:hypothetical protein